MIGNIQILRAFAASGVVIFHENVNFFGVHTEFNGILIFFVLSGYLMCCLRDKSAINFAMDRFWRIVPSYWLAMVFMLVLFKMWLYYPIEHMILSAFLILILLPFNRHNEERQRV